MVLLVHVRKVNRKELRVCHVYDPRTALINRVSGRSLEKLNSGIWNLNEELLRRYGKGGLGWMVYASRLLKKLVRSSALAVRSR